MEKHSFSPSQFLPRLSESKTAKSKAAPVKRGGKQRGGQEPEANGSTHATLSHRITVPSQGLPHL